MQPLSRTFNREQPAICSLSPLLLLFWAVLIDNDVQRQDKERRQKNQHFRQQQQRREIKRPLAAPQPF